MDKSYQKYKYKVKMWETEFKKTYGRIPSKHDIHEAELEIREAYKMYFKLKSALLEETLMDISFDDLDDTQPEDSPQCLQPKSYLDNSCINENKQETLEQNSESKFDLEKENTCWNVDKEEEKKVSEIWGSHLSNKLKKETKVIAPKKEEKPIVKLSQKLFKNSSFSKRNPRKSLSAQSLNRSESNSSISLSQTDMQLSQNSVVESLPDIDQLLQSQAETQHFKTNSNFNSQPMPKTFRSIDKGWLDRCSLSNSFLTNETEPDSGFTSLETNSFENSKTEITEHQTFGLRNIDVTQLKTISNESDKKNIENEMLELDDIVYNSESEDDSNAVMQVLKKRKIDSAQISPTFKPVKVEESKITVPNLIPKNIEVFQNDNVTEDFKQKDYYEEKFSISEKKKKMVYEIANDQDNKKVVKRSGRSKTQKKNYAENEGSEEEDPFSFNSDDDPEFIAEEDPSAENNSELKKKNAVRKPSAKKTKIGNVSNKPKATRVKKAANFHKSLQVRKKTAKNTKETENNDEDINSLNETEYALEFAIDPTNTTNVSRFGVQMDSEVKGDLIKEFATAISTNANDIVEQNLKPVQTLDENKLVKASKERMNENFVRIDIKKKVFVRGKKPMNYSRYKKARWKERKAAALAGPDMDMGGCDGGLLKCFRCGHIGHFSNQCKAKIGDKLLPLEQDVEICPYPTLEEASAMADSSLLLVHANRPHSIPQASKLPMEGNKNKSKETEFVCDFDEDILQQPFDDDGNNVEKVLEEQNDVNIEHSEISQVNESEDLCEKTIDEKVPKRHVIPEALLSQLFPPSADEKEEIMPLYNLNSDGSLIETPKEVYSILNMFGHKKFRPGQEKAVMRILSGLSTLVTLSTGSGKSLCYQLPAYLYAQMRPCITLVISPLVSLMEDQVTGVPDFLHATCLHTNQTQQQREKILQAVQSGMVNILLVSPEAVVSGEKKTGFGALLRSLPPIAFACIDEAHCVSQWSHNFRPSYLMICQVLREKLGVKTVLGLTATATRQTRESIVRHLQVPDGLNGIISDIPLPNNLNLSVSKDYNRDRALIELLRSERFSNLQSIIVYCTRRQECERLASFIRTCLQDNKAPEEHRKRKRSNVMWNAEPYHAGMSASRRRTIQNAFMRGNLRIVVATVAFGMGINKSDIRAIIHYNMPRTFENYVQEVGRAGRDGLEAHCHLFLDSKGEDQSELKRHIYADSIDRHVIRKLLQRVFLPCKCAENIKTSKNSEENQIASNDQNKSGTGSKLNSTGINNEEKSSKIISNTSFDGLVSTGKRVCPGHEVAFSVSETVQALDIPEENISTLLCYLELHQNNYVHVLSSAYTTCQITSYGGPKQLRLAAQSCPPLAMAIALDLKRGINHDQTSILEFKVIDIAAAIGWDSGVVKYNLKKLEWSTVNGVSKRSTLNVEFSDLGFRVRSAGDLTDEELDETLDMLYERTSKQENKALIQLQSVFEAMTSVAFEDCIKCSTFELMEKHSNKLKLIIREYFQQEQEETMFKTHNIKPVAEGQIISDVRAMIGNYPENNFTGRALARIFYGIQSPNYPAVIWGRCRYWRKHLNEDFHQLIAIANREIIKMR